MAADMRTAETHHRLQSEAGVKEHESIESPEILSVLPELKLSDLHDEAEAVTVRLGMC